MSLHRQQTLRFYAKWPSSFSFVQALYVCSLFPHFMKVVRLFSNILTVNLVDIWVLLLEDY